MIRLSLTCLLVIMLSLHSVGQIDFNTYMPIVCKGKIPADLTANAKLNYERKAIKIEDSEKGKRRQKDEKEFYLQNNFSIQDFFGEWSGALQ